MACPVCGAQALSRQVLVHHMTCAAVFPVASEPEPLICPKCADSDQAFPDTFEATGALITCGACGHLFAE
jgi:rubredoxin